MKWEDVLKVLVPPRTGQGSNPPTINFGGGGGGDSTRFFYNIYKILDEISNEPGVINFSPQQQVFDMEKLKLVGEEKLERAKLSIIDNPKKAGRPWFYGDPTIHLLIGRKKIRFTTKTIFEFRIRANLGGGRGAQNIVYIKLEIVEREYLGYQKINDKIFVEYTPEEESKENQEYSDFLVDEVRGRLRNLRVRLLEQGMVDDWGV